MVASTQQTEETPCIFPGRPWSPAISTAALVKAWLAQYNQLKG